MHFGLTLLMAMIAVAALVAAGLTLLVARLTHPRPRGPHPHSTALIAPSDATIPRAFAAPLQDRPGQCALHPLTDPLDALAARLELIEAAETAIDLQYYIWQNDIAGALMLDALRRAAARGVRVRLLLDDNGTAGLDETLSAFARREHIEVRLFNPFPIRGARVLGYLSDFRRLNRRMHNKAMVVDGTIAIVGGRNVGDDYFNNFAPGGLYMDLDLAVAGPVVSDIARAFDAFWNTPASLPAPLLLRPVSEARAEALRAGEAARLSRLEAAAYRESLAAARAGALILGPDAPEPIFAEAHFLSDPPDKIHGGRRGSDLLWHALRKTLGQPREELVLMTPYLVPTRQGTKALARFAKAGIRVKVLTNSFAATDVPLVHSGYAHRRRPLLRAGIQLFEYAPDAETRRTPGDFISRRIKGTSPFSRNKLHAKVFAVDRVRVFVGSFNFDPRSMRLNTENGLVVSSPELAAEISDAFEHYIPERAWEVKLAPLGGRLMWHRPGQPALRHEPNASIGSRVILGIAQRLPIEWML
ncbi:phospholipase D-like domain-containing protein [Pseudothioclava nitratireducens]|uniref:phospholipase D-like domain-containing protein n=1 Tax=Pseudothioclava nitratireducens TaxID=1928646 RepID=UPI0023DAFAB2|nr:phospholipase D family protein [Defluviimonas nitratireducens]MDF1621664.1 phospholipase D family protein [Defluviimonas nitratireducens]